MIDEHVLIHTGTQCKSGILGSLELLAQLLFSAQLLPLVKWACQEGDIFKVCHLKTNLPKLFGQKQLLGERETDCTVVLTIIHIQFFWGGGNEAVCSTVIKFMLDRCGSCTNLALMNALHMSVFSQQAHPKILGKIFFSKIFLQFHDSMLYAL